MPEEALAAYDGALELNPHRAAAHVNKGSMFASLGRLDEAVAEIDVAGHLAPNGAGQGTARAGAILWQHDTEGARSRFHHMVGQVTGCIPFHTAEMEAVALCGLSQPAEAGQFLRGALPFGPPSDYRAARDLRAAGRPAPAGHQPAADHHRAVNPKGTQQRHLLSAVGGRCP